MSHRDMNQATSCVHAGVRKDNTFNAVITPIYATSTFAFEAPGKTKGHDYSRTSNPTRSALEECLAALEGGARATATSTGMAAEATILHLLPPGSHVITGNDIYGGTYRLFSQILSQRALSFSFVNMRDLDEVRAAWTPETRAVWIETPSNPLLNLVDIAAVSQIAKEHGAWSIVDNTFLSPIFQQPFALGADVVVHSTTKYLNGHSDIVGGAVISKSEELGVEVAAMVNNLGTCCSPFDAWLVLRGIKTLPLRMKQHEANAMRLAEYLDAHPEVERVYYPGLPHHPQHELARRQMSGFGGMLSFDIKGGAPRAFEVIEKLKLFAFAESLGGVESLIEHPDTMSHASMTEEARRAGGISPSNVRISVGIEDVEDLVKDLEQAFGS